MRLQRSLVLILSILAISLAVTGCFGGTARPPAGATSLSGTLRNEYGHPVRSATLTVGSITATTGQDGAFRLAGVPGGNQTVVFKAT
ncbi:MAG: carboxypeptidase-like regulatory domain-containing protein, partial [Chitinophagales bacterium]